jgi:bacterioferritin-associated ferredoxin
MVVCHCKGLSDRDIRRVIETGARTPRDVTRQCGAGSVCGGCRPVIHELLDGSDSAPAPLCFELAAAS